MLPGYPHSISRVRYGWLDRDVRTFIDPTISRDKINLQSNLYRNSVSRQFLATKKKKIVGLFSSFTWSVSFLAISRESFLNLKWTDLFPRKSSVSFSFEKSGIASVFLQSSAYCSWNSNIWEEEEETRIAFSRRKTNVGTIILRVPRLMQFSRTSDCFGEFSGRRRSRRFTLEISTRFRVVHPLDRNNPLQEKTEGWNSNTRKMSTILDRFFHAKEKKKIVLYRFHFSRVSWNEIYSFFPHPSCLFHLRNSVELHLSAR